MPPASTPGGSLRSHNIEITADVDVDMLMRAANVSTIPKRKQRVAAQPSGKWSKAEDEALRQAVNVVQRRLATVDKDVIGYKKTGELAHDTDDLEHEATLVGGDLVRSIKLARRQCVI